MNWKYNIIKNPLKALYIITLVGLLLVILLIVKSIRNNKLENEFYKHQIEQLQIQRDSLAVRAEQSKNKIDSLQLYLDSLFNLQRELNKMSLNARKIRKAKVNSIYEKNKVNPYRDIFDHLLLWREFLRTECGDSCR